MKPKNEERLAAMKAEQLTYVDKHAHVDQKTKKSCGTFVRYAKTGKCVACARGNSRGTDNLAPAGVRLLLRDTPKAERMEVAIRTYVEETDISIMRCSFLFSLNNQDIGEELKARGLTRTKSITGSKVLEQHTDVKRKKTFNMAMQAFAPKQRVRDLHRGEA